ncbi:MAG: amino acid ABC transporter substrate-binding protein [Desulfobacterales bacterium]|nr:amino acid ABC transporter substrate-binding protein [Desulfobacterales bacterium]
MLDKVLLILLILLCFTIVNADQKIVKIATLGDYAPYCMADKDVKLNQIIPVGSDAKGFKGYSWDVVRESFHKMGYTIHLSISPWIRP